MTFLTEDGRAPCVAIVAPGSRAPDNADLALADARLLEAGCQTRWLTRREDAFQRFGAADAERAAQLHAAADDKDVDIVLALRGGYGMSRLLPLLDAQKLAASGKLFVGHSDMTALHMLLLREGRASYSGPMVCDDFTAADLSPLTLPDFWRCLKGPRHEVRWQAPNPALQEEGMLWGGNLSMLVHLVGTPWLPRIEGGILFLEDVSEHPFRVERMLLQLHHAGVLARQRAIVLGDFSNYRLGPLENGYDMPAMLDYIRSVVATPILTGLPFGHIRDKVTLPIGAQAQLASADGLTTLALSGYPTL